MAARLALVTRGIAAGGPGGGGGPGAALLGLSLGPAAAAWRSCASQCEDQRGQKWRRPKAGTSGACPESAVRFYAARSKKAEDSAHCFAIAERLHQFAVIDSLDGPGHGGAACAKHCAGKLTPCVARSFAERVRTVPLRAATDQDGSPLPDEATAAAAYWADSLAAGFVQCDQMACQEAGGGGACGALLCVVAESGVYVASVGLGRAVVGTEVPGGEVLCDEASSPHCSASEAEVQRLREEDASGRPLPPPHLPTRLLGGLALKQAEPRLVGLPDVVRHEHAEGRRFIILGTPGLWDHGPRLPVQWAVEAYRSGRSPADELVSRSRGEDVVALVVVLPAGLGKGDGRLPPHEELLASPA